MSTTPTLTWSSTGATSYDVKFGTTNPPPQVSTGQTAASYAPATLPTSTTVLLADRGAQRGRHHDGSGLVVHDGRGGVEPGDRHLRERHPGGQPPRARGACASDPTSPNGVKLITPDTGFAVDRRAGGVAAHYVDVTFNANAGTPYRLWLRMQALNNSKFNDSLWVQFSDAMSGGSSIYPMNTTSGLDVNLATDCRRRQPQPVGLAEHGVLALAADDGHVRDERHAHDAHSGARGRRAARSDRAQQLAVPDGAAGRRDQRLDDRAETIESRGRVCFDRHRHAQSQRPARPDARRRWPRSGGLPISSRSSSPTTARPTTRPSRRRARRAARRDAACGICSSRSRASRTRSTPRWTSPAATSSRSPTTTCGRSRNGWRRWSAPSRKPAPISSPDGFSRSGKSIRPAGCRRRCTACSRFRTTATCACRSRRTRRHRRCRSAPTWPCARR